MKDNHNNPIPEQTDPAKACQPVDQSRRKFTRAGLIVSGAVLTLKSAPVLAGKAGPTAGTPTNIKYRQCESPSGFASINTSAPGKTLPKCGGLSPGGWAEWPEYWPTGYSPGTCAEWNTSSQVPNCLAWDPDSGTPFHMGVTGTVAKPRSYPPGFPGFAGSQMGTMSLMAVILSNQDLAKHCAASVLNAAKGLVPPTVFTVQDILDMWYACAISPGYFEPTAGTKWYAADCVTYLKSTMG